MLISPAGDSETLPTLRLNSSHDFHKGGKKKDYELLGWVCQNEQVLIWRKNLDFTGSPHEELFKRSLSEHTSLTVTPHPGSNSPPGACSCTPSFSFLMFLRHEFSCLADFCHNETKHTPKCSPDLWCFGSAPGQRHCWNHSENLLKLNF